MHSFRNIAACGFIALGLLAAPALKAVAEEQAGAAAVPSDAAAAEQDPANDKEMQAKLEEFRKAFVHGPAKIDLGGQASLQIPQGDVYIPKAQALPMLEEMGNHLDPENFLGLVVPEDENQKWFVAAEWDDSGFIKDDDQSNIKADEILDAMKKDTLDSNKDRAEHGIPALEIVGWIEPPHYDTKTHHLVWSIEAKEQGKPTSGDNTVNYNTFALGRGGYISLNLITSHADVEGDKKYVKTLLDNLSFESGKRYEDFNPKTDKIAEYGLIALIGGIAAKKLGLFALLAAVVAKSAKVLVVAAVGGLAALKKFFKRRDPTV